ncbi:MAG: polysaccharide biosynthesis tyrosine autokinase [Bacteroidales bacterium]|nr:polysaccharide biosynthesis tyrosine autokinase [Bacteroidales bacterium]
MEREITSAPVRRAQAGASPAAMLKAIFGLCLRNWYWFAISLAVALGIAWLQVKRTPPVYLRSASIMIKQNGNDGMDKTMMDLGIEQASTNLVNEILLMNSSVVAEEVVRRLNLTVDYLEEGTFYDRALYGLQIPLTIQFLDMDDNARATMTVDMLEDSTIVLSQMTMGGQSVRPETLKLYPGDTLQSPMGRIVAQATQAFDLGSDTHLKVVRSSVGSASGKVRSHTSASLRDKSSSIIDIRYRDVSLNRADDVLNTLITVYNEMWMRNRNKQIVSTNEFIRDRLAVIEEELGSVDDDISSYKSQNLIPDVSAAGSMAVAEANEASKQASELVMKISQLRTTYEYLSSTRDDSQQIPLYSNIDNGAILQRISEYNQMVLRRNNHLSYSSAQNPLVVELNKQLAALRQSIVTALSNEISSLQVQQNALRSTRGKAISRVAKNPQQANYLLSVERQQKVKESLYLFLLQKREENELSQAFTAYNTQLIEPAHGSWEPIEPVVGNIFLMAFIIGLLLPALVLAIKEVLNTTVRSREDFKTMQTPFAGVIPQAGKGRRKKVKGETTPVLVKEGSRNMVNEAFRVVRSNLEFMLGYSSAHKAVMVTSINPDSGKTFITANLAKAISLKGKKVLAIDLDLRKANLSSLAGKPKHGISGFLAGKYDDVHSLIVPVDGFDILPCGALPPNPSELLYSARFQELIETLKGEYDFVLMDCPPVEVVADPAIAGRYADMTIFVARSGMLEKSLLPEIDQWYADGKYNGLVVLLNGADAEAGHYGYHKYGYYSYGTYGAKA